MYVKHFLTSKVMFLQFFDHILVIHFNFVTVTVYFKKPRELNTTKFFVLFWFAFKTPRYFLHHFKDISKTWLFYEIPWSYLQPPLLIDLISTSHQLPLAWKKSKKIQSSSPLANVQHFPPKTHEIFVFSLVIYLTWSYLQLPLLIDLISTYIS